MRTNSAVRVLFRVFLVLALVSGGFAASPTQKASAAVGGPVILGGDDLRRNPEHWKLRSALYSRGGPVFEKYPPEVPERVVQKVP